MKDKFVCSVCGRELQEREDSMTTGYGVDGDGNKSCFDCCGKADIEYMKENGKTILYLSKRDDGWVVSNWPGTLKAHGVYVSKGRHNIAGTRYDTWFNGPDGHVWHGVRYGEWTEILHCKRTKETFDPKHGVRSTLKLVKHTYN